MYCLVLSIASIIVQHTQKLCVFDVLGKIGQLWRALEQEGSELWRWCKNKQTNDGGIVSSEVLLLFKLHKLRARTTLRGIHVGGRF